MAATDQSAAHDLVRDPMPAPRFWADSLQVARKIFMTGPEDCGEIRSAQNYRELLTDRQIECLRWISQGKSSTDIGAILNISGRTVDYHVTEICRKLDVRTRTQAVAYALQRSWLTDD